eukprot:GFYU01010610.1.p1 GENE.GFYU01010610.1~~GFYU01010610.1.p1  ORF type:complete len:393 (-),score=39.07 GFYU01010610.1:560-1699(-)
MATLAAGTPFRVEPADGASLRNEICIPIKLTADVLSQLQTFADQEGKQPDITLTLSTAGTANTDSVLCIDEEEHKVKSLPEDKPFQNSCFEHEGQVLRELGAIHRRLQVNPSLQSARRNAKEKTQETEERKKSRTAIVIQTPNKNSALPNKRKLPVTSTTTRMAEIKKQKPTMHDVPPPKPVASTPQEVRADVLKTLATGGLSMKQVKKVLSQHPEDSIMKTLKEVATLQPPAIYVLKEEFAAKVGGNGTKQTKPDNDSNIFARKHEPSTKSAGGEWAPITSLKEYEQYRKVFEDKYKRYSQLLSNLEKNASDFKSLGKEYESCNNGDPDKKKKLKQRIQSRFKDQREKVKKWHEEYNDLHEQLAQIKQQVTAYVQQNR